MKNFCMILSLISTFAVGWLANEALQTRKTYAAAKSVEYKVVPDETRDRAGLEKILNTYAQQGWRYHSYGGYGFIFER